MLVDARIAGKGERRFFTNKSEAEGLGADIQRVRRQNQGTVYSMTRNLPHYGLTIADAIKFTLDHYRRQATSAPVDEAIRQLLESKKAAGEPSHTCICSRSTCGSYRALRGRMISTITANDIERFLAGLDGCSRDMEHHTSRLRDAVELRHKGRFAQEKSPRLLNAQKESMRPPAS